MGPRVLHTPAACRGGPVREVPACADMRCDSFGRRRSVLARVVQISQHQREVARQAQATKERARQEAAAAAQRALSEARESLRAQGGGQGGAQVGKGAEPGAGDGGGGQGGAPDPGGSGAAAAGGMGNGADAAQSFDLSRGLFEDDSLQLSGVLPSLDDEEMRLLSRVLQDTSVPLGTPGSLPSFNIFRSPRRKSRHRR